MPSHRIGTVDLGISGHWKMCRMLPKNAFSVLRKKKKILADWLLYEQMDHQLMTELCAIYSSGVARPDLTIKAFEDGESIICDGDASSEVFFMMTGRAVVQKAGCEVGQVSQDDCFGETSLLLEQPRTADVIADGECTVHVIPREMFTEMIKNNPQAIVNLTTTLAKRLAALNDKVSQKECAAPTLALAATG